MEKFTRYPSIHTVLNKNVLHRSRRYVKQL